jgi:peptidoglycan/xylan/chitin deacetylase (PgdA/CDA1 family)
VVLTFDDGYLDNLENALPILREFEIPATIYIATDAIGTTEEFWWDDLERLVLHAGNLPEVLRLRINDRMREWRLDLPNEVGARERVFFEIHAELRPLPAQLQADVRAQLRALTKIPSLARPLYRCMNVSELSALAADPLITLGAHTMSHCDLDYRTKDQQEFEIGGSKRRLEEIIGYRVDHFSYPYGSFNRDCLAVCAENNFRSAVAGIESSVRRDSHRFCLPRRFVRDWDGPRFERKLKRAFRG